MGLAEGRVLVEGVRNYYKGLRKYDIKRTRFKHVTY